MKKKSIAVILSILLFGLTACSGNTQNDISSMGTESGVVSQSSESEKDATTVSNTVESESQEQTASEDGQKQTADLGKLTVIKMANGDYEYSQDLEREIAHTNYESILLSDEDAAKYPKLAETLKQVALDTEADYKEQYVTILEDAKALEKEADKESANWIFPVFDESNAIVLRADERLLSIQYNSSSYLGGVHGYNAKSGECFDTVSGKKLSLRDIFTDVSRLAPIVSEKLQQKYSDEIDSNAEEYIQDELKSDDCSLTWVIDNTGVTFIFNPYEIACYAAGILEVKLSFREYAEIFNPYYAESAESYAISGFTDQMWSELMDVDGDGTEEEISIYPSDKTDWDTYENLVIYIDDVETSFEADAYQFTYHLVHTSQNRSFLYVNEKFENDYMELYIYELTSKKPVFVEKVQGYLMEKWNEDENRLERTLLTDPDNVKHSIRTDLLSTTDATRTEKIGEDGRLLPVDSEYYYIWANTLTTKQDIACEQVDQNGKVIDKKAKIPAGTKITFYSTDANTYVTFETDGKWMRVMVDCSDWPETVNGIDAEELFDDMCFAG